MKKSLFIAVLCASLGACAGQAPAPQHSKSLLSFTAIAAEIKVTYEALPTTPADSELVARTASANSPESP